jgi:threonine dehydrogenase-like Zn-dependent dehydrogenase
MPLCSVSFAAYEYQADGSFKEASYRYEGSEHDGWRITREGEPYLELPPGYRLLRTLRCGICATDLARSHLAFPLPQIIGHEVIAQDECGTEVAVEINASHASIGSPPARPCRMCSAGLARHCPDRMVLGIDRLPGGFAPWVLAPRGNIVEVPRDIPSEAAVLIEPFAAAVRAAERIRRAGADRIAVVGLGRLGLLLVAALAVIRRSRGLSFSIRAIGRREDRLFLAQDLGADEACTWTSGGFDGGALPPSADIVVEATGNPQGLERALPLASREVHVKSTTGRETLGLRHLTELVVDEISLESFCADRLEPAGRERGVPPRALIVGRSRAREHTALLEASGYEVLEVGRAEDLGLPSWRDRLLGEGGQARVVVVGAQEEIDRVVRPWPGVQQGAVQPEGSIALVPGAGPRTALTRAILEKRLLLSTSRCGDFRIALPLMAKALEAGIDLGRMVTDVFSARDLPAAFARAGSPGSLKVVVVHPR